MCTVPLPPGVYPIAVDKYIDINKLIALRKKSTSWKLEQTTDSVVK